MSFPRSPRDYAARGASSEGKEMTLSPNYQQQQPQLRQPSPIRTLCIQRNNDTASIQSLARSRSTGSSTLLLSATSLQNTPRRLSSGSACETCRRRKTKCDGGYPCAYCATNQLECIHRAARRKRSQHGELATLWKGTSDDLSNSSRASLSKQTSCPSLLVTTHWPDQRHPYQAPTPPSTAVPQLHRHRSGSPLAKEEIPSMMDQLSCRTFSAVVDQHRQTYPIYPLGTTSATSSTRVPASATNNNNNSDTSDQNKNNDDDAQQAINSVKFFRHHFPNRNHKDVT